jgi:hypothetical protein
LVAATAILTLLGVAAYRTIADADWFGRCTQDGSGRDGIDCPGDLITDDAPARWFGFPLLAFVVLLAAAWLLAWVSWTYVHRRTRDLPRRAGPFGSDDATRRR